VMRGLQTPVMARRRKTSRRRRVHEGGEVWVVYGCGKREKQGFWLDLNRVRNGGGAAPSELRPSMAIRAPTVYGNQEGGA
jgi:hypothetical protein